MGKINVLPFSVANLIAAGEVVDRPASVVKELCENAIDAGATRVTVEIQKGGVALMRVTDNGCGMTPEDLPIALRRHATSKIKEATDLDAIMTLGFRGEALAAISSVSDVRILSRMENAPFGACLESRGGVVMGVTEQGCSVGTSVIVEHLFANVPARRKFLKKDITEAIAVQTAVEKIALSHPGIAFRLIVDGTMKLETPGDGNLKSAVYAVYGRDFASRLLPLQGEYDGITVSGFTGRSDNVKANRAFQNFFINHRYVKSRTAMAALEQAYTAYLPPERFPVCVMEIAINPARVDVNVHPAKLEVKFSNEKPVFDAIYYTVRNALEQNVTRPPLPIAETAAPSPGHTRVTDAFVPVVNGRLSEESLRHRQVAMDAPTMPAAGQGSVRMTAEEYRSSYGKGSHGNLRSQPLAAIATTEPPHSLPESNVAAQQGKTTAGQAKTENTPFSLFANCPTPGQTQKEKTAGFPTLSSFIDSTVPPENFPPPDDRDSPLPQEEMLPNASLSPLGLQGGVRAGFCNSTEIDNNEQAQPSTNQTMPQYRIVGEVFQTYVMVEKGDKLLLIDKHAAHERVIFESFKAEMKRQEHFSQMLMLPIEIPLTGEEIAAAEEYRAEIEAVGFSFTLTQRGMAVTSLSAGIETDAVPDVMTTIIDRVRKGTGSATLTREILFEKALFQASCKAAIKGGRDYADAHIKWLVEQLMALPDITFCPHGRPVAMELTHAQLDHMFKRT